MCYQSFIDPEATICDEYYDSHSIKIVSDIQNALSFSNRESVLKLLSELKNSPDKKKMSVHSLQQLVNGILTNTTLIKDESDDYIYNYKQLTGLYSSIDECIDNLIEKLSQSNKEPEAGASISNFYFLKIMKYINTYYTNDISLKDVADVVNLNPNYISQMFKKATGTTFTKYLTDLRIKNAQNLLLQTTDSINEISLKTGFNDYFYFLKIFKKYTGKTPSEYRNTAK
jgi:two-component system response regulator YesN